jgi:hypothetical protein
MTNTEFEQQVQARVHALMGNGGTYKIACNGVELYATGHYDAGRGAGYSRHGEAIDPPEPPSFELTGLHIGDVNIMPMFAECGEDLLNRIEQLIIEQVMA